MKEDQLQKDSQLVEDVLAEVDCYDGESEDYDTFIDIISTLVGNIRKRQLYSSGLDCGEDWAFDGYEDIRDSWKKAIDVLIDGMKRNDPIKEEYNLKSYE